MKSKICFFALIILIFSSVAFAFDNVDRNITTRKELIRQSNDCVKKVRDIEHKNSPDKLPMFDAYVTSWRGKIFSKDNESIVIPKFKFQGDSMYIEIYKKCMEE